MNRRELIKSGVSAALVVAVPVTTTTMHAASDKIELYKVAGVAVFPYYAGPGTISARQVCFPLIERTNDRCIIMGHYRSLYKMIGQRQTEEQFTKEGIARFRATYDPSKSYPQREEGGLMPEDGEIIEFIPMKRSANAA